MKNVRIGEVLKEYGYITDEQLEKALVLQKEDRSKRVATILMEQGWITEKQMLEALAERLELELVDLNSYPVNIDAVEKIPQQLSVKYQMLGIGITNETLIVAINDPMNLYAVEDIHQLTGLELKLMLSTTPPLQKAIDYFYSEVRARLATVAANQAFKATTDEIQIEEGDGDAPVIKLLNSLIIRGYNRNASDIHIEPFEEKTIVRMRIDGTLVEFVTLQRQVHVSLIARIKIMANLNIAEKRQPQDGHFRSKIEGEVVNIRASVIPTVFGEKAVLRLLSNNARIDNSSHYGMNQENYEKFTTMLSSPNGIVYLTGPTGSGKTTTLYMALETMAEKMVNISTIEDPVEKNIMHINQMQVNPISGLTFDVGLRALLRQDPDIIMVGETRDAETANISVRAAITGHLVFSTLHTNSAVGSIVRLMDMGLQSYLIANSLVGIVAQRLVKKVCPHCGRMERPTPQEALALPPDIPQVWHSKGCEQCNKTGYSGRIAIHEILLMDKPIRAMISANESVSKIEDYAIRSQGMKTLSESAMQLVKDGVTSVEEMKKITFYS